MTVEARASSGLAQDLLNFLQDHRDQFFEDLIKLVGIESPSGDREALESMLAALEEHFHSLSFRTLRVNEHREHVHLYARPDTRDNFNGQQLLIGHADTVWPIGKLEENPIEVEENQIKGPGVYDMKAGLLEIIYALKAIDEFNVELSCLPVVFINSDEEIGSPESTRYIERLAKCVDRVFVMEPSLGRDGKIKTERKGIGHFVIRIEGKAAHAGIEPEKGSNAIVELSRLVQELNKMNEREKGLTVNVGKIDGGMRTNVVAPESKCEIDVRVPTKKLSREIEEKIRGLEPSSEQFELTVEGGFRRPPMEFTDANRRLWEQIKESGNELGLELERSSTGGASDGNTASQYAPTIDGMGAVGDGAHEEFEFIYKDKVLERCALLALTMTKSIT